MILSDKNRFAKRVILSAVMFCLVLPGILIGPGLGTAQAKAKVRVIARCCPLVVIIIISGGANARLGAPNGEATLEGNRLTLQLNSSGNQKEYLVDKETKLDDESAKALGYSEVILLPGKYPLRPLKGGKFEVTINARTKPLKK